MFASILKFQCQNCLKVVATDNMDRYVACGHCDAACQVPQQLQSGIVLDDFVIEKHLGDGSMGCVYLAHQYSLDRRVALKVLKEELNCDQTQREHFLREARAVAALKHPNIIQAYKVGQDCGIAFFATEYVEGCTLTTLIETQEQLKTDRVLKIALAISDALTYAWNHSRLIHHDIKPDNIMILQNGEVKLMDFGLSSRPGDGDSDNLCGTPQYMAPEIITKSGIDHRSDYYSLGATLYECLSGHKLFEGPTHTVLKAHLSEEPRALHDLCPNVNKQVCQLIHKMLSKDPDDRQKHGAILEQEILQVLKHIHNKRKKKRNTTRKDLLQTDGNHTRIITNRGKTQRPNKKKKNSSNNAIVLGVITIALLLLTGLVVVFTQ